MREDEYFDYGVGREVISVIVVIVPYEEEDIPDENTS